MRRNKIEARPAMRVRETGDTEWWTLRALLLYSEVVSLVGVEPVEPCKYGDGYSCGRRRCDACEERADWDSAVLDMVADATGWGLTGSNVGVGGCPGQRFSSEPGVYRHARHPRALVVSWAGGLDI